MTIYTANQQNIARIITTRHVSLARWRNWRWQLKHAIRKISSVESVFGIRFEADKRMQLKRVLDTFPLSITPYYLSLIAINDYRNDPVFRQAFPSPGELELAHLKMADPLAEEMGGPVPGITHRDPGRVFFQVSNICAMSCRHCTRRRKVSVADFLPGADAIQNGLTYIRGTPEIKEVLLCGRDPLMHSDRSLGRILGELRRMEHVEVIRIATRMLVVLPCRITSNLLKMLRKHHPVSLRTHFNHPREITTSSRQALRLLADAGIPVENQAVRLAGVNDCPQTRKSLAHKLLANRVSLSRDDVNITAAGDLHQRCCP